MKHLVRFLPATRIAGFLLILALASCGGNATTGGDSGAPAVISTLPSPTAKMTHFKVGQYVTDAGWLVTITKVALSHGAPGDFATPKAGYAFLDIDVRMQNITRETLTASTAQFDLRDPTGMSLQAAIQEHITGPDGPVLPGKVRTSTLAYGVATTTRSFVLVFNPDFDPPHVFAWDITV